MIEVNPKDIRVGNLLYPGIVTAVIGDVITVYDGYCYWSSNKQRDGWLEGIHITDELLINNGFTKQVFKPGNHERGNWVHCSGLFSFQYLCDTYYYESSLCDVCFTSVHYLQNLFKFVTGTELEIKPKCA